MASLYLFLLGLTSGVSLLTISAYRRVSPAWLRWLLIASGLLVISRYVTLALFTHADAPRRFWALRHCWFATSIGLTLPSVFAIDQLLQHPAISPKKLLHWCLPLLVVYGAIILFGHTIPEPDRIVGWTLHLSPGWQQLLSTVQVAVGLGFMGLSLTLMRRIPSVPIRKALFGLLVGVLYLEVDGLLLALGRWYFRPFLYSELLMLLALWHAYDTSARFQVGR